MVDFWGHSTCHNFFKRLKAEGTALEGSLQTERLKTREEEIRKSLDPFLPNHCTDLVINYYDFDLEKDSAIFRCVAR